MSRYHLAPSLVALRAEVDALWPARDRRSDGWVGDFAHSARVSDHNPDYAAGGVVRAIDLDEDGIDTTALLIAVLRDERTEYVIYEGLIYRRDHGFKPERYTGANSHHLHMHVSIRHTAAAATDTSPWGVGIKQGGGASAAARPREDYDPMIYRAGGRYATKVHGIYAHNGVFVELSNAEERTNLMRAGVPEVWILENTLRAMIEAGRS